MAKAFAVIFGILSIISIFLLMKTAVGKEMLAKKAAYELKQNASYQILLIDLVKNSNINDTKSTLMRLFPREKLEQNATVIKIKDICFDIKDEKVTSFCN